MAAASRRQSLMVSSVFGRTDFTAAARFNKGCAGGALTERGARCNGRRRYGARRPGPCMWPSSVYKRFFPLWMSRNCKSAAGIGFPAARPFFYEVLMHGG